MTDSDNRAYVTHDSASMLLPWYINGSLDDEQRKMVDSHIAVCLTCRSELNTQRHIAEVQKAIPAERLLIYQLGEGWNPLCHFLDVPVPEAPFPRRNSAIEFNSTHNDQKTP